MIARNLAPIVRDAMADARVVVLLGARQSGKTTLVRALVANGDPSRYFTLDDAPTRELAQADPTGFVAGIEGSVAIDEVQRSPELMLAVKARVDRDPTPGQYLLTGSANLRQVPAIADALPGRADYLTLFPFTQDEIARRHGSFVDSILNGEVPAITEAPIGRDHYLERLLTGGYPEAQRRRPATRSRFFESYVTSIIERDVPDVSGVRDQAALRTVLQLVAARSGSLARYDALGRDAGLDGKTAKAYGNCSESQASHGAARWRRRG